MAIEFYYGSGSPYGWRVWLALEHKRLAYELKLLSFSAGDLRQPEFLRLNPRGRVPVIADRGFVLYESAAILEYLEEAWPPSPLFPADLRGRALARRMIREADQYLAAAMEILVDEILYKPREAWDAAALARGREAYLSELGRFEQMLADEFFAGAVGAVDYTVYPLIALGLRMQRRAPDLGVAQALGPKSKAWMARIEALPAYATSYPPHWKA